MGGKAESLIGTSMDARSKKKQEFIHESRAPSKFLRGSSTKPDPNKRFKPLEAKLQRKEPLAQGAQESLGRCQATGTDRYIPLKPALPLLSR